LSNYKLELSDLLGRFYPKADINDPESIAGQFFLRFELGGNYSNGSVERVNQATERASTLFQACFQNSSELIMLIYDYDADVWQKHPELNAYLYDLLERKAPAHFEVDSLYKVEDLELAEADTYYFFRKIGKFSIKQIPFNEILGGIANLEMGFEPVIPQQIFFVDPKSKHIFYMYDDRGCLIYSPKTESLEQLYLDYNKWLVDEYRNQINEFFEYLFS
jgi:hypothetical protein